MTSERVVELSSADVARTTMFRLAPTASKSIDAAVRISPVRLSMLKSPAASSSSEYVMALLLPSRSSLKAVIPTYVTNGTFSSMLLAAALVSTIGLTSNSSRSLIVME